VSEAQKSQTILKPRLQTSIPIKKCCPALRGTDTEAKSNLMKHRTQLPMSSFKNRMLTVPRKNSESSISTTKPNEGFRI